MNQKVKLIILLILVYHSFQASRDQIMAYLGWVDGTQTNNSLTSRSMTTTTTATITDTDENHHVSMHITFPNDILHDKKDNANYDMILSPQGDAMPMKDTTDGLQKLSLSSFEGVRTLQEAHIPEFEFEVSEVRMGGTTKSPTIKSTKRPAIKSTKRPTRKSTKRPNTRRTLVGSTKHTTTRRVLVA